MDFRLFQRVIPGLVAEEVKRRGRAIRAAAARNRVLERGLRLALAKLRRLLLAGKVGSQRERGVPFYCPCPNECAISPEHSP